MAPTIDAIRPRRNPRPSLPASAQPPVGQIQPRAAAHASGWLVVVVILLGVFFLATQPSADQPPVPDTKPARTPTLSNAEPGDRIGPPQPDAGTSLEETVILDAPVATSREQNGETGTVPAATSPSSAITTSTSYTVRILNGSGATGLAATYQDQLKAKGLSIQSIGTATNSYQASIVYYQPGKRQEAEELVIALGAPTVALQENVVAKPADILLVLGKDRIE